MFDAMSPLTFWLSVGAATVISLYLLNSILLRTYFRKQPGHKFARRSSTKDSATDYLSLVPVLALLVCLFVPDLFPNNGFTKWLLEPYSKIVLVVWAFLLAMILSAAFGFRRLLIEKKA